jgi:hypothetical protein
MTKFGQDIGLNKVEKFNYGINVKQPSKQVMSLVSRFSKLLNNDKKLGIIDTYTTKGIIKNGELYIRLVFLLEGVDSIPKTEWLLEQLGTTEKLLRSAKEKLEKLGILEKQSQTRYKINKIKLSKFIKEIKQ